MPIFENQEDAGDYTPERYKHVTNPNYKWSLTNLETEEIFVSQFPPVGMTGDVSNVYSEAGALNMQNPIMQWVRGNTDTLAVPSQLYSEHSDDDIMVKLNTLIGWTRKDEALARPPILMFRMGDGTVRMSECVIESITGITYVSFREHDGKPRDLTFTVNLRKWFEFKFDVEEEGETRYHRAKSHDYYEWLTYREYGDPILGDIIRKDHPTKPYLSVGDVVKLPNQSKLRKSVITPRSVSFKTAYGRKETPQRTLRLDIFDRRNVRYVSYVV